MKTGDIIQVQCDDKMNHAYGFNGTKGVVVRQGRTRGGEPIRGTTVVLMLGLKYQIWFHDRYLKVLDAEA